jgi:hypothetical protein
MIHIGAGSQKPIFSAPIFSAVGRLLISQLRSGQVGCCLCYQQDRQTNRDRQTDR